MKKMSFVLLSALFMMGASPVEAMYEQAKKHWGRKKGDRLAAKEREAEVKGLVDAFKKIEKPSEEEALALLSQIKNTSEIVDFGGCVASRWKYIQRKPGGVLERHIEGIEGDAKITYVTMLRVSNSSDSFVARLFAEQKAAAAGPDDNRSTFRNIYSHKATTVALIASALLLLNKRFGFSNRLTGTATHKLLNDADKVRTQCMSELLAAVEEWDAAFHEQLQTKKEESLRLLGAYSASGRLPDEVKEAFFAYRKADEAVETYRKNGWVQLLGALASAAGAYGSYRMRAAA